MPRVLAFIEALGVTGAARNLLESGTGVDLHVATYRRRGASPAHHDGVDALVAAIERRGLPAIVIDERHAFDPWLVPRVRAVIARVRPDIVQTHNIKSHALVARARNDGRLPWIAFHHGYTDTDLKVRVYNRLDRRALRQADLVVTTCAAFARDLTAVRVDPRRIAVMHNGATPGPLPSRTTARRMLGLDGRHVIVALGRLSREKGHDTLIDACAAIDPVHRADLDVVIAGDGPERGRLASRAAAAGVRLRLDGFQPHVAPYYAAADVLVLPSRSEGSPNVLLEALAAACPIVATRAGGIPEIVEDGVSALLVTADRPLEMRNAMLRVLSEPATAAALRAGARETASRFTPEARRMALHSIYAGLLGSPDAFAGAALSR